VAARSGSRFVRAVYFAGVSVVIGVFNQMLLFGGIEIGLAPVLANIIAVLIATALAYEANLKLTWAGHPRRAVDVVTFFVFSFIGLVISSVAVDWAVHQFGETIAANAASIGVWGALWMIKFLVLDGLVLRYAPDAVASAAGSDELPVADPAR
jgi:hypothetical protein